MTLKQAYISLAQQAYKRAKIIYKKYIYLPQTPVIPIQIKRLAHVIHRVVRAAILRRDVLSSAGSLLSRSYS